MSFTASEAAKVLPIVGAASIDVVSRFWGLTLSEWFYIAAILYTIVQTVVLVYNTITKEDINV